MPTILLLRHGHAGSKAQCVGNDAQRAPEPSRYGGGQRPCRYLEPIRGDRDRFQSPSQIFFRLRRSHSRQTCPRLTVVKPPAERSVEPAGPDGERGRVQSSSILGYV